MVLWMRFASAEPVSEASRGTSSRKSSSGNGPVSDPASLNRAVLEAVARRIEPLLGEVVFVGGQVSELLITSRGARGGGHVGSI